MALDTKHKRGSAMIIGMPFRPWLSEPAGTIGGSQRLSLLRFCGSTTAVIISGPFYIAAQQAFIPGAVRQDVFQAGATEQQVFQAGAVQRGIQ